jgi:hypothetical protein
MDRGWAPRAQPPGSTGASEPLRTAWCLQTVALIAHLKPCTHLNLALSDTIPSSQRRLLD